MEIGSGSVYINPNTGSLTSNIKNTYIDKQRYGKSSSSLMNNFAANNDASTVFAARTKIDRKNNSADFANGAVISLQGGYHLTLRTDGIFAVSGGNGNETYWKDAMDISSSLTTLLDVASGRRMMVSYEEQEWKRFEECTKKAFECLGLDFSKDFTINGMQFCWDREQNRVFSKSYLDAKEAFDIQRINNRRYETADERTRREIEHKANYFLRTTPENIQRLFGETIEETGTNPFAMGNGNVLSQLAMEQDFATGGNDQLFGDTVESSIEAVNRILERIDNPLGTITEEKRNDLEEEKQFYMAFLYKLENMTGVRRI